MHTESGRCDPVLQDHDARGAWRSGSGDHALNERIDVVTLLYNG
jgi:hypothetical protein